MNYTERMERAFTPATPCGQVSDGIACDTPRKGTAKLCPDCNPWRPEEDSVAIVSGLLDDYWGDK